MSCALSIEAGTFCVRVGCVLYVINCVCNVHGNVFGMRVDCALL